MWNHGSKERKLHLVNWNLVCQPKANGGLGIKQAQILNNSLLMKLAWRFSENPQSLWAQLIRSKYSVVVESWSPRKHLRTNVCKSIIHGFSLLQDGLSWRIGNGTKIQFWVDKWCSLSPLSVWCVDNFNIQWDLRIANVLVDGFWDMNLL